MLSSCANGKKRIQVGMTTSFTVVGSPIEHSLSPVLHTAAYKHLGLDFAYGKSEVLAGGLIDFLDSSDAVGVSVTMPLKHEAFDLAVSHDEYSLTTGVSNTLVRSASGWRGFNTDVYGICQALSIVSEPRVTVVIGSGATARSGMVALSILFPNTEVHLVSRNQDAGVALEVFGKKLGLNVSIWPANVQTLMSADLVMSLVPAGSYAELWEEIQRSGNSSSGTLFDVAYNPWPSKAGLAWDHSTVISGIEMLIWQAIEQVQLFASADSSIGEIDRSALYSVMKEAVSSK
jgi:shikimate dehydrogenase